jgi:kynurenine formamidase
MTDTATGLPSYSDLRGRTDAPAGSAWRLFGDADEVGTLNLLTPDRVREARELVRTGEVVNLDLPLDAFTPALIASRRPLAHHLFANNPFHRDDWVDSLYTQSASQVDGLRHIGHPDHGFYNGADPARFREGEPYLGINRYAERGIAGRGVLLDVGRYLKETGSPIGYSTNEGIGVPVLEATADAQGVAVAPGDILMIRFGWVRYFLHDLDDAGRAQAIVAPLRCPGLEQSHEMAGWLWDHGVAMVAADNFALEAWPPAADSPFVTEAERTGALPRSSHTGLMHRVLIPLLGMAIGELWALDDLAARCAADGVWDCLVTVKPLTLTGGAGSPANALAIR